MKWHRESWALNGVPILSRDDAPAAPEQLRTCALCGETKPLYQFERDRRLLTGYSRRCRLCANKRRDRTDE